MINALSLRLRAVANRCNPRGTKERASARRKPRLQVEGLEGRALLASITEFVLPSRGILGPAGSANQIVTGPDGNLWFTENDPVFNAIGRITPSGHVTEFKLPTDGGNPFGITVGPDGNLWFTENFGDKIGRITPSGQFTEFPIGLAHQFTQGITTGPDGNLWFCENGGHAIAKMTTSGQVTQYPLSSSMSPVNITTGPNGNLWFTDKGTHSVGEITTSGLVTEFTLPSIIADPTGIVTGPGGDLWVTEDFYGRIAQISAQGELLNEYTIPSNNPSPNGITVGPDNNIWFAEQGFVGRVGGIGELNIVTGQITEFAIPGKPQAYGITRGPDGRLWFTDRGNTSIGAVNIGTSTFHSPTVTAQTAVFLKAKKKFTGLQISFSGHLDPFTAANLGNYQLGRIKKGHTRRSPLKTVPVGLSALSYNATTNIVTLIPPTKLKRGSYQLVILSSSSGGVLDAAGQSLVGGNEAISLRV
jgi:streptogramin lyase